VDGNAGERRGTPKGPMIGVPSGVRTDVQTTGTLCLWYARRRPQRGRWPGSREGGGDWNGSRKKGWNGRQKKEDIWSKRTGGLQWSNEATTGPKKGGEIRPVEKHHMMLDKEQMGTG